MLGTRTDLAMEATELFRQKNPYTPDGLPPGVSVEESGNEEIKITRVKVLSEAGEKSIGKPIGNYITLEIPGVRDDHFDLFDQACAAFTQEMARLMPQEKSKTVLVVGLGNWNITPDALGPKVVSQVIVTRHLLENSTLFGETKPATLPPVCAISPGVMGITGIETYEIVRGVVDRVHPDIILVVDALASRKAERVCTTIQIADTGIAPGSGVGNKRMALNQESLGRPVIAIGVPTVIDAATLAADAIALLIEDITQKNNEMHQSLSCLKNIYTEDHSGKNDLVRNLIRPYYDSLIVSPKEIDEIIKRVSEVIADGINFSLGTLKH